MPTYNFKTMQVVPPAKDFIDIVLSKTQRGLLHKALPPEHVNLPNTPLKMPLMHIAPLSS